METVLGKKHVASPFPALFSKYIPQEEAPVNKYHVDKVEETKKVEAKVEVKAEAKPEAKEEEKKQT